jgi:hypothetical protein
VTSHKILLAVLKVLFIRKKRIISRRRPRELAVAIQGTDALTSNNRLKKYVLVYYIRQHNYIYNYTLIQGVFCLLTTCFGHLCDHPEVYKSKQLYIS